MSETAGALREPWPDLRLQREGVGLGMWIFLASEVLFFAALFCGYAVYRSFNVEAFRIAGAHTEIVYGSINTVLLLTSSLTMTVALRAATVQLRDLTLYCLGRHRGARRRIPRLQRSRISRRPQAAFVSRPAFSVVAAGDADVLGLLLDHDRHSCRASHRPASRSSWWCSRCSSGASFRCKARPWRAWRSIGISSNSVWLVLYPLLYLAGRS